MADAIHYAQYHGKLAFEIEIFDQKVKAGEALGV